MNINLKFTINKAKLIQMEF